MKYTSFSHWIFQWVLVFVLAACAEPVMIEKYRILLPELPAPWAAFMGEPEWRVSWAGESGRLESAEFGQNSPPPEIRMNPERAGMVLAWAYWPGRNLPPGSMRPAGAIVPYDVSRGEILLSWEAGPEANFFLLMAARTSPDSPGTGVLVPAKNRAWNFDWPRFRALLYGENMPPEIREDPWLADWPSIAEKTLVSGFDRRRIKVPPGRSPLELRIPADGPWIGTSPFIPARDWKAGDTVILEAGASVETIIAPAGQIQYREGIWIWIAAGE